MTKQEKLEAIAKAFTDSSDILTAIGDETRRHIILEILRMGKCSGVRVGEITEKTNLSRPAVSHHLRILKDAGIIKVRKEATKNYYYLDPKTEALEQLVSSIRYAVSISRELQRCCDNE